LIDSIITGVFSLSSFNTGAAAALSNSCKSGAMADDFSAWLFPQKLASEAVAIAPIKPLRLNI
jgi:hypothetical protein